jgi:hypothetical protein
MQTPPTETNEYALCQSVAEVILIGDKLCGREIIKFVVENVSPERGCLMRAAAELKRGRADPSLIELVKAAAKTAPRSKTLTFSDRLAKRLRKRQR